MLLNRAREGNPLAHKALRGGCIVAEEGKTIPPALPQVRLVDACVVHIIPERQQCRT